MSHTLKWIDLGDSLFYKAISRHTKNHKSALRRPVPDTIDKYLHKRRWIHRLILQVVAWLQRKHWEVDYYLTQILNVHGCFKA